MSYHLPKEIASKFWTSLKTVYNYLSKHKDEIRRKKENWKTIVNFEDFKKTFYKTSKAVQSFQNEDVENWVTNWLSEKNEPILNLQKQYNLALQKSKDLEKYNVNLQNQVSKYAILLQEEKQDKKERQAKYDQLNQTHFETIATFWKEKVRLTKQFFILLGICLSIAVLLLFVMLPSITKWVQSLGV